MVNDIIIYILDKPKDLDIHKNSNALLIHCAKDYLNKPNANFIIKKEEMGKPYFENYPNVHFSISHSNDYFICGFSNMPLGIDIQYKKQANFSHISKRFFNELENQYLEKCDYNIEEFYKVWTAKESCVKLAGTGIANTFSKFSVIDLMRNQTEGIFLKHIDILKNYSLCLAAREDFNIKFKYL